MNRELDEKTRLFLAWLHLVHENRDTWEWTSSLEGRGPIVMANDGRYTLKSTK